MHSSVKDLPRLDRRFFLQASGVSISSLLTAAVAEGWQTLAPDTGKDLLVHSVSPHNAEPSLENLMASWITPTRHFYVRSHAPVPQIDADSFRLSVGGMVREPFQLTLQQLQTQFPKQSLVATLTCAGNRRSEHSRIKPVSGVQWQAGAIGNARWGGAKLSDLLKKAGLREGAKHVWFEGVDEVPRDGGIIAFGASIPVDKAMADSEAGSGALVAYEMNDQPLSPDHGFPLRTVVPGYIGARSVKWLGKIIVSDRPSENHYVAHAYKLVTQGTDREWSAAPPIETFVINSVTCSPAAGTTIQAGLSNVSGYALAPGLPGRTIKKVELSPDDGRTWHPARFTSQAQPFCWQLWSSNVPITPQTKALVVRATDSAGKTVQPQRIAWNLKGYLFNAWHRTPLQIEP